MKTCLTSLVPGLNAQTPAWAACSSKIGKVVVNEYNYINNYIELKVLDPTLTAGGANPFAGWKLAVWKKQGGGKQVIDLFRPGQSSLPAYPASINSGYSHYDQCATIESALPSSAYDAPLTGNVMLYVGSKAT